MNKYYKKRRHDLPTIKENDVLCQRCYEKEHKRMNPKKTDGETTAISMSKGSTASSTMSLTTSASLDFDKRNLRIRSPSSPSIDLDQPLDDNMIISPATTPHRQTSRDLIYSPTVSPSGAERELNHDKKLNAEKLNELLQKVGESPIKDQRNSNIVRLKCNILLNQIKSLATSITQRSSSSSSSSAITATDTNDTDDKIEVIQNLPLTDMIHLVSGLRQLVCLSEFDEQIRLLTLSPPNWSRRAIASFFPVTQWQARISIDLRLDDGILAKYENTQDRGKITAETIAKVLDFFEDDTISRVSPNVKDVIQIKDEYGNKHPKQCRFMLISLTEAFENFKEKYSEDDSIKIGHSKFCQLLPKWIKQQIKHNSCLCVYHENYRLLLTALSAVVQCSLKSADFINSIVCNQDSYNCMSGECPRCKDQCPSIVVRQLYQIDLNDNITWMTWTKVNQKLTITRVTGTISDLLSRMDELWSNYILHYYITSKQYEYIKELKNNLSPYEVVVQMDFAENHSLEIQSAIQSNYWSQSQAAIFTVCVKTHDAV
ncbi:unnamed protein product, partial [Didymodactylos carnosus]